MKQQPSNSGSMKMPYETVSNKMYAPQPVGNSSGSYRAVSASGSNPLGSTTMSSLVKDNNYMVPSNTASQPTQQIITPQATAGSILSNDPSKYWKMPPNANTTNRQEDIVVIHVCDENQQLSRDFCCKRDILVEHMKYFQKFLSENDGNGYEDIDISVHCDVEIFEWLMSFIHEPETPPKIDKSIMVSILISSEFLQMDKLVDLCIAQMTQNMNEIIKLPIDLSCISEKLINRIASLLSPKVSRKYYLLFAL